VYT
jgi:arylformamidase